MEKKELVKSWINDNVDFVHNEFGPENWYCSGVVVWLGGEYNEYVDYVKEELAEYDYDYDTMSEDERIEAINNNQLGMYFETEDELIEFVEDCVDLSEYEDMLKEEENKKEIEKQEKIDSYYNKYKNLFLGEIKEKLEDIAIDYEEYKNRYSVIKKNKFFKKAANFYNDVDWRIDHDKVCKTLAELKVSLDEIAENNSEYRWLKTYMF